MGWVWKDDDDARSDDLRPFEDSGPRSANQCSTRKIVKSQCRTEEVETGKFVRKCEKTEQLLRDCVGRPTEVMQSNKEYTEEDVTEQMTKGSELSQFNFPGLRSDIEAIERSLFGGVSRFFEAAEDMKNGFFSVFGSPHIYDGQPKSSVWRGIPIASQPTKEPSPKPSHSDGHIDLSGLAKDV